MHLAWMEDAPAVVVRSCLVTEWLHALQTLPVMPELGILKALSFLRLCRHAAVLLAASLLNGARFADQGEMRASGRQAALIAARPCRAGGSQARAAGPWRAA